MTSTLEECDSFCAGFFTLVFNMNKQKRSTHSLVFAVKQLVFSVLGSPQGFLGCIQAAQTHRKIMESEHENSTSMSNILV